MNKIIEYIYEKAGGHDHEQTQSIDIRTSSNHPICTNKQSRP